MSCGTLNASVNAEYHLPYTYGMERKIFKFASAKKVNYRPEDT